jgi:hypothetical protein
LGEREQHCDRGEQNDDCGHRGVPLVLGDRPVALAAYP